MFTMTLKTDNAAFEGEALKHEVARILREVANLVEGGAGVGICRDINGNRVGNFNYNPFAEAEA